MFRQLEPFIARWRSSKNRKHELDVLLARANPKAELYDRAVWMIDLLQWIRYAAGFGADEYTVARRPVAKVKFLLNLLDRNPEWKARTAATLRSVLADFNSDELLAEVGLPSQAGFWAEFFERLQRKILPEPSVTSGMNNLFSALFSSEHDAEWIRGLETETLLKVEELIAFQATKDETSMRRQAQFDQAMMLLAIDIQAKTLSPAIRARLDVERLEEIPMLLLPNHVESFLRSERTGDKDVIAGQAKLLLTLLFKGHESLKVVYRHLEKFGVNTNVVYALESIEAKLRRLRDLVEFRAHGGPDVERLKQLLLQLIEQNQARQSISALFIQNSKLLARQIVERHAESGEHYIARNKEERQELFKSAAGGGFLTAFTVYIKFITSSLHMVVFFEGFFYSLNYAISFLAIYFCGFTLATKQPSMTGATMAAKMHSIENEEHLQNLAEEITHLLKSQVLGILGNAGVVIPSVIVVELLVRWIWGRSFLVEAKAGQVFEQTSILSFTPLYAAITGIILWLSGVIAGWVDNWFALNRLDVNLRYNRRLIFVLGAERCHHLAQFAKKHVSGISANVALGFLLGLVPAFFHFFGIGLEVRHVTLQSGAFAAGIMHYGLQCFHMPSFYFGILGIISIAILNVGVNFSMSFFVAVRARGLKWRQVMDIYRALWK